MAANNILEREEVMTIGRELVRASGAGNPAHPQLSKDIQAAAFVALHSPTFRRAIANLAAGGAGVRFGE